MRKKCFAIPIACLVLLMATWLAPSFALEPVPDAGSGVLQADEQFRVFYRCEYFGEDETTRSGLVVITVVNRSGQPVREVAAMIPEFNATPFGHFPILVGDVSDGQAKEVVVPFTAFKNEIVEMAAESATWHLEFLDSTDTPMTVEVQGEMIL